MKKPYKKGNNDDTLADLIGLGRNSHQKSYYPQLQKKIDELNAEKEKYRLLIENSGDAIYLLYQAHFELVNGKFLEMFEITSEDLEAPGFDLMEYIAPQSRPLIRERMDRQTLDRFLPPKYEFVGITKTGKRITIEATVTYLKYKDGIAAQGILRDITKRKQLEEQLRQSQKMELVGQLAGGVAHDFNNLLTVISGYSELILNNPNLNDGVKEKISQIKIAGERAQALTNQLLAFSRKQMIKTEMLDLNNKLESSIKLYRRLIGEDISIDFNLSDNLPPIVADPNQIEQILMNLLVNARDAIREAGNLPVDKHIAITSELIKVNAKTSYIYENIAPGNYILFQIGDSGCGMDEQTRNKIFEPFFTTKRQGAGTGLGLSTVYGIVQQNNAIIMVESEINVGTTFKIYWPTQFLDETKVQVVEQVAEKIQEGKECILIVEDDQSVMDFVCAALESSGYHIECATSAEKALEVLETDKNRFDLIISDIVLQGMNGIELYKDVIKNHKEIPFILVSGYTDESIQLDDVTDTNVAFIRKPYTVVDLSKQIREMLEKG